MNDLRVILGSGGPYPFLLISSADHRSPLPGQTPTVQISQDGSDFAAPSGTVTEVGFGAFELAGSIADSEVVGPVILHAEAPGADPTDTRYDVVMASGAVPIVTGSTTYHPLPFLLVSSLDHITGLTNVMPTVKIRKPGGVYTDPVGDVTVGGFGWCFLWPDPADMDTPGSLLLHAEAPGADDSDERYFVAGRAVPGGGVHPDFLAALSAHWSTNTDLTGISPALYAGAAPPGPIWSNGDFYPYAVVNKITGKTTNLNTMRGYVEDKYFQVSIFHSSLADAINLGEIMLTALDPILKSPLTFSNGYQMTFYRSGEHAIKMPGQGAGGEPNVFQQAYLYRAMIGRTRATV